MRLCVTTFGGDSRILQRTASRQRGAVWSTEPEVLDLWRTSCTKFLRETGSEGGTKVEDYRTAEAGIVKERSG
jgi:hypothetical protein